ncbi:penicillin-binding protein [Pseudothermotoga hypogea DSM 11164 = NBRC 106472]|uniref:Penicillin-binding protein n=2 Tax=Pseudothermotoga TaxID=1643951 RepID=A0A0X1KQF4_9THEM|nr:penicillin-binding transpeptidase domain-containing protein [Pseudothermotoga hypogea]AJC73434.1 penicillin-binding protein [Pseudothermotoga hypogea DSM 11164 = NBRC 106472]MBC7122808.1 penicillin-binding protein [Pseudothermotoga sp.]
MKRSDAVLLMLLIVPFVILISRAFVLQVVEYKSHRNYVESLRIQVKSLEAPRGRILSRDGVVLAWDEETLIAHATLATDFDEVEKIVGAERKIELVLKGRLTVTQAEAIKLQRAGVYVEKKYIRKYNGMAPHVVGYVDTSRNGVAGVEKQYDTFLKGKPGYELVSVSPSGRVLGRLLTSSPLPGGDVILTIDSKLQQYAETLLRDSKTKGVILVQSVDGEILALASHPTFDPNVLASGIEPRQWDRLVNDPDAPLLNRATSALYAVGSVIKPLYAIAYLETGEDDLTIDCHGYYEYRTSSGKIAGVYKDWYAPGHGTTDLRKALRVSCNVFFYELALRLGINEMKAWADKFKISSITNIDLPGEVEGLFPDPAWKQRRYGEIWYPGDTILCGIGQGFITLTPLQILNFFNTVANRGTCYTPHVLLGTFDPNTKVMEKVESMVSYTVDVKPKTWDFLVKALVEVVSYKDGPADEGTAYQAFKGARFEVAGKTGTAEMGKAGEKPHSWFAGFSPVNKPQVVVTVLLENAGTGSEAAAPMARKILERYWELRE